MKEMKCQFCINWNLFYLCDHLKLEVTRMHSSRIRTARFSGCLYRGQGVCLPLDTRGVYPIHLDTHQWTPPGHPPWITLSSSLNRMTDRQVKKLLPCSKLRLPAVKMKRCDRWQHNGNWLCMSVTSSIIIILHGDLYFCIGIDI